MIIVMQRGADSAQIQRVVERLAAEGLQTHLSQGVERTVIGVIGAGVNIIHVAEMVESIPGVENVIPISKPFKLSSRDFKVDDTVITVGNVKIGGDAPPVVMAGPCTVENEEQIVSTAKAVKAAGATVLRGGAFKPSTSPYSFRGLGEPGLQLLAIAREETGLPVITEVMTPSDVEMVCKYADILQIGARNMQNYMLLDEVGKSDKPVMLKRGMSATIEEWLLAAEYILSQGNRNVMLCERGIRTFEKYTRNTFDLSAVPLVKRLSHLPVIADPAHGTGKWYLVAPMALAAIAAGANGLMVEVHPNPDLSYKDGAQSLTFENFSSMMLQLDAIIDATNRNRELLATGQIPPITNTKPGTDAAIAAL